MDRLRLALAGVVVAIAAPAPAADLDRWQPQIVEAARRFGIPPHWIRAVMKAESGGNRQALSPKGAMGLMQIMPGTWAELRVRYGLGDDPFDPAANILAGAAYLRQMHDRFGYPGLFAAYNAGPARYEAHLREGVALPMETRRYIATLAQMPPDRALPPAVLSGTRLFFPLRMAANPLFTGDMAAGADALFVPLNTVSMGRQ